MPKIFKIYAKQITDQLNLPLKGMNNVRPCHMGDTDTLKYGRH